MIIVKTADFQIWLLLNPLLVFLRFIPEICITFTYES